MRGTIIALAVLLIATSSVFAVAPTLSVVADDLYVGDGYKSFLVKATGTDWNILWDFDIEGSARAQALGGDVYQVFSGGAQTEWSGRTGGSGGDMDSYVKLATHRVPDVWPSETTPGIWPIAPSSTTETIAGGLTTEGMGTLQNPVGGEADAYCMLAGIDYTEGEEYTADLFHLVLPDGAYATVTCTLVSSVINPSTGAWEATDLYEDLTVQVDCPLDGDANLDGVVNIGDLDTLATYYNQTGGWAQGDFNGDAQVNIGDLDALATSYNLTADWYGMGSASGSANPVPEPATIVMLVLGSLCLAGYRLRK